MKERLRVLFLNEAPLIKYGLAQGFIQNDHHVRILSGEKERLWGGVSPEDQLNRLKKVVREFKPDLCFSEGGSGAHIDTICPWLKSIGIPHFYWAIEDPVSPHISDAYAKYCDFVFTTCIERIEDYKKNFNVGSEVLLFACNPHFHKRVEAVDDLKHDILLVASNYSNRYDEASWFVMPLVRKGYDVKIYGIWWDDPTRPVNLLDYLDVWGGVLPYERLPEAYSSAKIILGMNCSGASITQTSMRPYEAMGCGGGVFLGHYTKAQERLFGDIMYQAMDEEMTEALVRMILNMSDTERSIIAKEAQREMYSKHTYKIRAKQIKSVFNKMYK